jgi:hypothetical protein
MMAIDEAPDQVGGGQQTKPKFGRTKLVLLVFMTVVSGVWLFRHTGSALVFAGGLVGVLLIAGMIYQLLTSSQHPHTRDICFTLWFAALAILTIFLPAFIVRGPASRDVPKCIESWIHPASWFTKGVPCRLTLPPPLECRYAVELDQFLLWEVAAVTQTLSFGVVVFFEMKQSQFRRLTVLLVFAIIGLPLLSLGFMVTHWWHGQLCTTFLFLLAIFVEDCSLWVIERKSVSKKTDTSTVHELEFFARVTWGLDFPLLLATLILLLAVWGHDDELAKHFFAGGTAFSLIVANVGLVAARLVMHRHWLKVNPRSIPAFFGWSQ